MRREYGLVRMRISTFALQNAECCHHIPRINATSLILPAQPRPTVHYELEAGSLKAAVA